MPPRHAYWTILVDNQPTAFRAHDEADLTPTLNRLRAKHPSAVMKWFERGRLWESREQARTEGLGEGERGASPGTRRRPPDSRPARSSDAQQEPPRDPRWRPGGEHRDPRQPYKDARKAKWQRFKQGLRAGWAAKQGQSDPRDKDSAVPKARSRDLDHRGPERRSGRPPSRPPGSGERPWAKKPWTKKPPARKPWALKPTEKQPWGKKPSEKKPWGKKPWEKKPWEKKPSERKPWENTPWGRKPSEKKPWGKKPWQKKPWENKPWEKKAGDRKRDDRGERSPRSPRGVPRSGPRSPRRDEEE